MSQRLNDVPEEQGEVFTGYGESTLFGRDTAAIGWAPNELYGHDRSKEAGSSKPIVPIRKPSVAAHVDVSYFDPSGFRQLRRNLTQISREREERAYSAASDRNSIGSDITLLPTDGDFDFEKTLQAFNRKIAKADIKRRELGVVFQSLRVVGLGSSASYQPTIGSLFDPFAIAEKIRTMRHPPLRDILNGFEGVVRPGEMLLVLGRPGSGCSTFLKTLANQRDEFYAVEGEVHYDSISPEDIAKHYRGDVQYCPEDDIHFPSLNVEQTLNFAAETRAPHARLEKTRRQFIRTVTQINSTIFGLNHVRKTPVGDAAIRGISGGQKKRVSIAETMATRSLVNSWDNSTRGLDSSTALEFGRALRIATDMARHTTIVSLYQAGEALYQLFDKVCVIHEGKMAYFGPADQARDYFHNMGYEPANRQTTPDFLVAVTDPKGRTQRADFVNVPHTADEFAEYFSISRIAELNREDIFTYKAECVGITDRTDAYRRSVLAEHAKNTRKTSTYTISVPMQVRAVMKRRIQIILGNKAATIVGFITFVLQGIVSGTIFFRLPDATLGYYSRGGILFFCLLFSSLSSLAEIPALFFQRPIVLKHQKAAMYHPFVEGLAMTIVDLPISFVNTIVFAILIYFIVGLQSSGGQFFVFWLTLFLTTITIKAFFRTLASSFKSEAPAQAAAGISLLGMVLYTGYTIPKPSMIGALRWLSSINPMRYGFEALLVNEFHTLNGTCSSLVPHGAGYEGIGLANQVCATVGAAPGQNFVDGNVFVGLSYAYSYSNLWKNIGITFGFLIGFMGTLLLFTEFNTASEKDTFMVLFKRGAKALIPESATADEEEYILIRDSRFMDDADQIQKEKAMAKQAAMTDVFSWQHIDYTVPVAEGERKLLDDVSGYVAPGKLTVLMGESGAGKTTILNVLAQRVSTGDVKGDRFVDGQELPVDFQAQSGYCQQTDTHTETDTVREALSFSAKLRQPESVPLAEKEAYVETCLKMCGLESYADAIVGSLGVEQRKRTTIGVELAAKPKLLLFLDEPTSGLDSQSAWAIMSFLRELADNGQAILCTIHQPSAELFQVFDRLLLLRRGGQTVYFGDIGPNASTMIQYFEGHGSRVCDPSENPAEFMLDVVGAGATAISATNWGDIWKKSQQAIDLQEELDAIHTEGRNRPAVTATLHSEFATSWFNQTRALLTRIFISNWRNPTYLMAKFALNGFPALFIGFTFFNAKDSQQGTQNKLFAVYMSVLIAAPIGTQMQGAFIKIRDIYEIRERPSRMYSWSALITSQFLAEVCLNLIGSTIFFVLWYSLVGFEMSRAGYTYLMYGVLFPFYYTSFAQAVAAMAPNTQIAAQLFTFLFAFTSAFNGVLQPAQRLGGWKWMNRVSPLTYIIGGLIGQAIGQQRIHCSSVELVTLNPPLGPSCSQYLLPYINVAGGYLTNPAATSACEYCPFASTDQFLATNFNIFYSHRWRNLGLLVCYVTLNISGIYLLTYLFRIRTESVFVSLKKRFSGRK